jgi:hypothetical protein
MAGLNFDTKQWKKCTIKRMVLKETIALLAVEVYRNKKLLS